MSKRQPTVLFDIDGVTLDWFQGLPTFVKQRGLGDARALERFHQGVGAGMVHLDELFGPGTLEAYHASEFGRSMPPLEIPGTLAALTEIARHHQIVALTAFSDRSATIANRVANLEQCFPGLFTEVHSVAAFTSKQDKLAELARRHDVVLFVDDNRKHVQEGVDVLGAERVMWFRGRPPDGDASPVRVADDWASIQARVEELCLLRDLPPMPVRRRPMG